MTSSTRTFESGPVISIVIPVYNSELSLSELVSRTELVFKSLPNDTYEIIFVDDCSPDTKTWPELYRLSQQYDNVHAIGLSNNFGQAAAILCGMTYAKGQWIVTMDDDLQHRPEDIPALLDKRGHDVVIARFPEKRCGRIKKLTSSIKSQFDILLLNKPKTLASSPFRLIKKRIVDSLLTIKTSRPFLLAMLLSVTSDVVNVDVFHMEREHGTSNYSLRKSISLFSNMLFNNSSFMLRCMSGFGFFLAFLSTLFGGVIILKTFIAGRAVAGWASLMVVLLISTGAIIFCLGMLGEYIARLLSTAENQVAWAIKNTTIVDTKNQ